MKDIRQELSRKEGVQYGLEIALHLVTDKKIQMELLSKVKEIEKKIEKLKNRLSKMEDWESKV